MKEKKPYFVIHWDMNEIDVWTNNKFDMKLKIKRINRENLIWSKTLSLDTIVYCCDHLEIPQFVKISVEK